MPDDSSRQTQSRTPSPDPSPEFDVTTFPRSTYYEPDYLWAPFEGAPSRTDTRIVWAARLATSEWPAALRNVTSVPVTPQLFDLVCFDKVYEINQSEWPERVGPYTYETSTEWHERMDELIDYVYVLAANAVAYASGLVIDKEHVHAFCRAGMDDCFCLGRDAFFDIFVDRTTLSHNLTKYLGRYDPDFTHPPVSGVIRAHIVET